MFLSFRKMIWPDHPGSWIRIFFPSRIPDPGSRGQKAPYPESGSATLPVPARYDTHKTYRTVPTTCGYLLKKLLKDLLQSHLHQGNLVPLQLFDESRLTGQQEYHRATGRTWPKYVLNVKQFNVTKTCTVSAQKSLPSNGLTVPFVRAYCIILQ